MKNKMFKVAGLLTSSLLVMGMLVGCGSKTEEASTQTGENVIIMGTNAEFEPFEYRENGIDIVGFDVDLAQAVADKLGKELVVEDMAFDSLILALNSDKVDFVAAGMTVTEERATQVDFSDTYATSKQAIIVKADNTEINTVEDLAGKKVGVQLGTTGDLAASSDSNIGEVLQLPSGTAAVLDLKNGKIDAVVIDIEPAKKMTEGQSDLKLLETPFVDEEYAIAVKKGNQELVDAINETIAEMKADGSYDELYSKYFTTVTE